MVMSIFHGRRFLSSRFGQGSEFVLVIERFGIVRWVFTRSSCNDKPLEDEDDDEYEDEKA